MKIELVDETERTFSLGDVFERDRLYILSATSIERAALISLDGRRWSDGSAVKDFTRITPAELRQMCAEPSQYRGRLKVTV